MNIASRSQMSLPQRIALLGLLLCMALAQSLGLAHRSVHADVRMLAHTHEEQLAAHGHAEDCDHGVISRLFASHEEGDETCRVMDGAGTIFGINSLPAVILPALYAHILIAVGDSTLAAWQAPLFEARGPPVLSL